MSPKPPTTPKSAEKSRPKESHEERASRLKQKSLELRSRGLRLKIVKALTTHPWCLQGVAEHLRDVGAMDKKLEVAPALDGPDGVIGPSSKRGAPVAKDEKALNKNFTKLGNMPLNHVRDWLKAMEPVVFSDNNVKSIIVRGQIAQSRERLAQCVEFLTGIGPDEPLFEEGRDKAYLAEFVSQLRAVNIARGRVARDLGLPADWDSFGYYQVASDPQTDRLFLVPKYHNHPPVPLPDRVAEGATMPEHMQLCMNFSERRAVVKGPKGHSAVCRDIFLLSSRGFGMPDFKGPSSHLALPAGDEKLPMTPGGAGGGPPKRRRGVLAIEDYNLALRDDSPNDAGPLRPTIRHVAAVGSSLALRSRASSAAVVGPAEPASNEQEDDQEDGEEEDVEGEEPEEVEDDLDDAGHAIDESAFVPPGESAT